MSFKKSNLVVWGLSALIGLAMVIYFQQKFTKTESVAIRFDKDGFALTDLSIGNETYTMGLAIGTNYSMMLPEEVLKKHGKITDVNHVWTSSDGTCKTRPMYKMAQVKMDSWIGEDLDAYSMEKEPCFVGRLGGILGRKENALIDFPNNCIVFSQKSKQIKKSWISLPLKKIEGGIIVTVDTDFGKKNLMIQTLCSQSIFAEHAVPKEKLLTKEGCWDGFPTVYLEGLSFGKNHCEPLRFAVCPYAMPEGCDGMLGMDFLRKNRIYIDFQEKLLWLEPKQFLETIFDMKKSRADIVVFEDQIKNQPRSIFLDLGFECLLNAKKDLFDESSMIKEEEDRFTVSTGKSLDCLRYRLPFFQLGHIQMQQPTFYTSLKDILEMIMFENPEELDLLVGCEILSYTNLFLDFKNRQIRMVNSAQKLLEEGLISPKCLKIPYQGDRRVSFTITTGWGDKKVFIDTGATFSSLRYTKEQKESEYNGYTMSSVIKIGDRTFPKFDLNIVVQDKPSSEGVLGMDFLAKHQIYIDSANHMIWID